MRAGPLFQRAPHPSLKFLLPREVRHIAGGETNARKAGESRLKLRRGGGDVDVRKRRRTAAFFRVRKSFFREDDVRKTVRKKSRIEWKKEGFFLIHFEKEKSFLGAPRQDISHERLSEWRKTPQYPRKRRSENCLCFLTFLKTSSRKKKVRSLSGSWKNRVEDFKF